MTRERIYERMDKMLSADKEVMNEECKALAERDFYKVAREYFDVKSAVGVEVKKTGAEYLVTVSFAADRVKNFYSVK